MQTDHDAAPFNPVPAVIWALLLPMLAAEIVFQLAERGIAGPAGLRLTAIQDYAFYGQIVGLMAERGIFPPELLIRFVTYPFLHGGFTHFLFVAVFLLALGKMVAEVFRPWAVLAVFFGATIFGALIYALVLGTPPPLIGGFPAVYGLIGAFTFLLWLNLGRVGANQYRAFSLIGVLMGIQLLFGALFGTSPDWIADLAGFAAGFGLSVVVSPGGWARTMARLRKR